LTPQSTGPCGSGAAQPRTQGVGTLPCHVAIAPDDGCASTGPQVKGGSGNVPLLRMLRPRVVVPLENAEFDSSGLLADLLAESGGAAQLRAQLAADGELRGTRVELPAPGRPMEVPL
jgi:hypothetical protein